MHSRLGMALAVSSLFAVGLASQIPGSSVGQGAKTGQPRVRRVVPPAGRGFPTQRAGGFLPIGGGLPIQIPGTGGLQTGYSGLGAGLVPGRSAAQGEGSAESAKRWPSWVQIGGAGRRVLTASERASAKDPARALLVRFAERVELRPAGERAFYPLHFWNKTKVIGKGAAIRSVAGARAWIVLARNERIDAIGAAECHLVDASEQRIELDIPWASKLRVRLAKREAVLWLPDSSKLTGSNCSFDLLRESREAPWLPEGREHRLILRNWGPGKLQLRTSALVEGGLRSGAGRGITVTIEAGRRSVLPLLGGRRGPKASELAEALVTQETEGLALEMAGGGIALRSNVHAGFTRREDRLEIGAAGGEARVEWGGVRLTLRPGQTAVLDPLAGSPFSERRAEAREKRSPGSSAGNPTGGTGTGARR